MSVVEALLAHGVDPDQLAVASYGDTEPLASNGSADGRATNRRVELALEPSLDEIPGHKRLLWDANVAYAHGAGPDASRTASR